MMPEEQKPWEIVPIKKKRKPETIRFAKWVNQKDRYGTLAALYFLHGRELTLATFTPK